jgi:hypothetical protein
VRQKRNTGTNSVDKKKGDLKIRATEEGQYSLPRHLDDKALDKNGSSFQNQGWLMSGGIWLFSSMVIMLVHLC